MTKSIEDYFCDWEGSTIGFGYGTGEDHVLPCLKQFLEHCDKGAFSCGYKFENMEVLLGGPVTWLLISILCRADIIEYGSSPRYGWLTQKGKMLRYFATRKTVDELIKIVTETDDSYIHCYPDACNCGQNGYQEGIKCDNPFWT